MTGYAPATKTAVLTTLAAGTYISLHSADPGTTGANEIAGTGYARQLTSWPSPPSPPIMTGSQVSFTVPAGTTVSHWGVWTSGGAYQEGFVLPSPVSYILSGSYPMTPTLTVTG